MSPRLADKRVLILGAETEIGRAVVSAVADAGASVAAVAATSEGEAAFTVQRLAGRLSSGGRKMIAQAIDSTNEAAVRVMVRQVSKELGGLNAVVYCPPTLEVSASILQWMGPVQSHLTRFGAKELQRSGGGKIVIIQPGRTADEGESGAARVTEPDWTTSGGRPIYVRAERLPDGCENRVVWAERKPPGAIAAEVLAAIAGEAESG